MASSDPTTEYSAVRRLEQEGSAQAGLVEAVRHGSEAVAVGQDAMSDLDAALRQAIHERPYTALAVAGVIGFLYAVARR